jgi:hypothetical protein
MVMLRVMASASNPVRAGDSSQGETPSLKLVIAYEDLATAQRAMKTCERLSAQLAGEFQIQTNPWKFDLLRAPTLQQVAAEEIADADMVVISAHCDKELPGEITAWLTSWLGKRRSSPSALVAMLDSVEGAATPTPLHSYLQEAARQAQVDFFSNVSGFADKSLPDAPPMSKPNSSAWEEIFEQKSNYSRSGIDE